MAAAEGKEGVVGTRHGAGRCKPSHASVVLGAASQLARERAEEWVHERCIGDEDQSQRRKSGNRLSFSCVFDGRTPHIFISLVNFTSFKRSCLAVVPVFVRQS